MITAVLNGMGLHLYEGLHFSIFGMTGLSLTYIYFQFPLMILIISPSLEGLRKEWREAAENLGASPGQYWRHIGIPVLLPALIGAIVLLFGNAFSAYATAVAQSGGSINLVPVLIGALLSGNVSARLVHTDLRRSAVPVQLLFLAAAGCGDRADQPGSHGADGLLGAPARATAALHDGAHLGPAVRGSARALVVGLNGVFSVAPWLLGSSQILALVYVVLGLPFTYRSLDAGMRAINMRTLTEAAQSVGGASDRLIVLASHHGLATMINDRQDPAGPEDDHPRITAGGVEALLHRFPNVVLWVNGHRHVNDVEPRPDPAGLTGGFWEVSTASIADWPCQARLVELVADGGGGLTV